MSLRLYQDDCEIPHRRVRLARLLYQLVCHLDHLLVQRDVLLDVMLRVGQSPVVRLVCHPGVRIEQGDLPIEFYSEGVSKILPHQLCTDSPTGRP